MKLICRILPFTLAVIACGDRGEGAGGKDWTTERETVGDTTIVRTTGGSAESGTHSLELEWSAGEFDGPPELSFGAINNIAVGPDDRVYVFDQQARSLRVLDADGEFGSTIGRRGQGPGEYEGANGLRVLPDGRIVLWDPGTARLNVYDSAGASLTSWPVPGGGGFHTSRALFSDTDGNSYVRRGLTVAEGEAIFGRNGLIRFDSTGNVIDSLFPPTLGVEAPTLMAEHVSEGGRSRSVRNVPFAASEIWTWSPLGHFVAGRTDVYAVHLTQPDGKVLRIEREFTAPAVTAAEKANQEEIVTYWMKRTQADWRWNGPAMPDRKPLFRALNVGEDGRIWVSISQPSEEIALTDTVERAPDAAPPTRWREPTVYDVFDPDGTYLGRVPMPARTTMHAARGDHVWGIMLDEDDVQQVVRWRVTPGFGERRMDSGREVVQRGGPIGELM
jgi:hypothetical protein